MLRPFDLTIGQAALILVALSFAGAALVSLFTMMFSELTKNSVATIGTITGVMLVTMFINGNARQSEITFQRYGICCRAIWFSLNGAFRYSALSVGGSTLAAYQYAPFVYAVLAVVFALIGKLTYNRYQISGR